jgi:hypothetical protein
VIVEGESTESSPIATPGAVSDTLGAETREQEVHVETVLAKALERASAAGQWDVVAAISRELEARRLTRAGNVVRLSSERKRRS